MAFRELKGYRLRPSTVGLFLAALGVLIAMPSIAGPKTAYAPSGEGQFVGRAINKQTGQPLPGAWILATYVLGAGGVHEQAHCSIAEAVRANEAGEYVLPFHEGLPPQYIDTFAHRFEWAVWPRSLSKDRMMRWVVNVNGMVDGQLRVVRQEGPFGSEQEALKASRKLQDVWLTPFAGTDDEWLRYLIVMSGWKFGCKGMTTGGGVVWREALLAEASSMPDSTIKQEVMKQLRNTLDQARRFDPEGAARSERNAK